MTNQQPSAAPPRAPNRTSALVAVVGIVCAGICAPLVSNFESSGQQHLMAYHGRLDPPGVYTICDGDTLRVKPTDRETPAGCAIRLDKRLADFAKPVLVATPGLYGHPNQLAAAISLAYNIGAASYAKSTVAVRFNARQWPAACDAFAMWNKAGGQVVAGLVARRAKERALCLKDLPA
jgi:lysozyme